MATISRVVAPAIHGDLARQRSGHRAHPTSRTRLRDISGSGMADRLMLPENFHARHAPEELTARL